MDFHLTLMVENHFRDSPMVKGLIFEYPMVSHLEPHFSVSYDVSVSESFLRFQSGFLIS